MKNDFDLVAPVYDTLARLVFGKNLDLSQQTFLDVIQPNCKVLIVGGGTGKLIEWIPEGLSLEIDYVELSKGMLRKAGRKSSKGNQINFMQGDARAHQGSYDLIIANFFLDCFTSAELPHLLSHLKSQLSPGGKLLVTDFYPSDRGGHSFLLKMMHWFFGITAHLEAKTLIDIHDRTKSAGFEPIEIQFFRSATLFSAVYSLSH